MAWLQWSPWDGAFANAMITGNGPSAATSPIASPERGLAMWLDGGTVTGVRFASTTPYATFTGPLLVADTSWIVPDGLVLPGATTAIRFDAQLGLVLAPGASAYVADVTYAGLTLDFDSPSGEPPLVVLRDDLGAELVLGDTACPTTTATSVHIERSGSSVRSGSHDCGGSLAQDARVSLGFRGSQARDRSVVRNVRVVRH